MHIIKPVWLTHGGTGSIALDFVIRWSSGRRHNPSYSKRLHAGRILLTAFFRTGERKDFEVYSCDVSPDGKRLVTAAGGERDPSWHDSVAQHAHTRGIVTDIGHLMFSRWLRSDLVH